MGAAGKPVLAGVFAARATATFFASRSTHWPCAGIKLRVLNGARIAHIVPHTHADELSAAARGSGVVPTEAARGRCVPSATTVCPKALTFLTPIGRVCARGPGAASKAMRAVEASARRRVAHALTDGT